MFFPFLSTIIFLPFFSIPLLTFFIIFSLSIPPLTPVLSSIHVYPRPRYVSFFSAHVSLRSVSFILSSVTSFLSLTLICTCSMPITYSLSLVNAYSGPLHSVLFSFEQQALLHFIRIHLLRGSVYRLSGIRSCFRNRYIYYPLNPLLT